MRQPYRSWLPPGLLCFAVVVAVSGCGSLEPTVSGTVSLDGELLSTGSIMFVPVEGTPGGSCGTTITKGSYRVSEGLTEGGTYRVEIQGIRSLSEEIVNVFGGHSPQEEQVVSPEYRGQNSKLIRTLQAGDNLLHFNVSGMQNRQVEASN